MSRLLLVGSDPEFFVEDDKGNVKSIIGKLGGTKKAPIPVKDFGKGFAYQEDNVLAEFNIPPAQSGQYFAYYNQKMLDFLAQKLSLIGLRPRYTASEVMPEEELNCELAWVYGCEPDFNVYTLEVNPRPHSEEPRLRSGGGHLHVGYKMSNADKIQVARAMDCWLGLWSVLKDKDKRRRELYGKAGCIRFKPYGFEYRTLSNFWLKQNMTEVFDRVHKAVVWGMNKTLDTNKYADQVQKAINTSNKEEAKGLMRELGIEA